MIIHQPTIKTDNGEVILSARIEFDKPLPNIPKHLWFSFPESYAPFISDRGEAFLLSMLIPALYFNEDIELRAEISPIMAQNIWEYIGIYRQNKFAPHHIDIKFPKLSEHIFPETPSAVTSPFSGGIDSMYTIWSHLPETDIPTCTKLTHGIFIQGFDTFLYEEAFFNWVYQKYSNFFQSINLQLIRARTNVRQFSQFRIGWVVHHNPALKSFPFALGKLVSKYYQPSTEGIRINKKSYMQMIADPLLSVESLEVSVHGSKLNRTEKIEQLSSWEMHNHNIRICIKDSKVVGELNCQTCEKCLRTMIAVQIAGLEKSYTSFDYKPLVPQILRWWWKSKSTSINIKDFLYSSKKHKRWGEYVLLWILFPLGAIKDSLYKFAVRLIPKGLLFKLKTKIFPGDKVTEK
jgi:hypothetical protein